MTGGRQLKGDEYMKKRALFTKLTLLCAGLLFFASCSMIDSAENAALKGETASASGQSSGQKFSFSGSICVTGALPASLCRADGDSVASRSALPSYNIGSEYYYFVTATQTDGSGTFSINSFNNPSDFDTTNGVIFALSLGSGTWQIISGVKRSPTSSSVNANTDPIIMSDTYPATLSAANPVVSHIFYPKPSQSGSGLVGLSMAIPSTVSEVTAICSNSNWRDNISVNVAGTSVTVMTKGMTSGGSTPSGSYEVTFNFFDEYGILLYSTVQTINVFDNMTTNTWLSDGSGVISDSGEFSLTADLVSQFARTTFYVGQTAAATSVEVTASNDTGNGSPYAPFETVTKAVEVIAATGNSSKDYRIFVSGTVTGAHEISDAVNGKANSITIQGYNGLDTNGEPKDALSCSGSTDAVTLKVVSTVPVTLKNIKLLGDSTPTSKTMVLVLENTYETDVTIEEGVWITGNDTSSFTEETFSAVFVGVDGKLTMKGGKISGNKCMSGGGIVVGGTFVMTGGEISGNEATAFGGGVYNAGSMFMYGSAVIGDSTKTTAATDTTENGCSNKAECGAGIYSLGNLYLGYSDADTEKELTGGVFYNFSHDTGGIYQYANKTFLMNSGFVSYNAGRGIYVGNCSFTMSGGSVIGNTTFEPGNDYQTNGAGIYAGVASTVLISGGTISENEAGEDGGGLYIAKPETSVTISGGTISSNTAEGNGNGIALMKGALKMQGGASVDSNNDVYLASEKYIEITDALTATSSVATITPENYTDGTTVLEADSGVTLADEVGKFTVTPDGSTQYYIASDGKMYNYKPVAQFTTVPAAGDTAGLETMDDFEKVAEWVNAGNDFTGVTLILLTDVTLDSSFTPVGDYNGSKVFTGGTFDGNNKTITYDNVSFTQKYSGIFSGAKNATIQNLNLEGTLNVNADYAGCVIGHAEACTVKNCSSSVTITVGSSSQYGIGGIVGVAEGSYISAQKRERTCYILDCVNTGSIITETVSYIGGIVGKASVCVIRNCINKGNITGAKCCGGIVGLTTMSGSDNYGSLIENCGNNGNVSATSSVSYRSGAGGIAGGPTAINEDWYPHINNCYSSGTITCAYMSPGGIFGYDNDKCVLSKCYYSNPSQACSNGSPSGSSQYTNVSSILNDMNSLNNSDSATYRRWKVSGSVLEFE